MFGNDSFNAPRYRLRICYLLDHHMNSLCLAMILATRPTSVNEFVIFLTVWVTFSQYTYVFLLFGNDSRDAPRYGLRIYFVSYGLANMFEVNL